MIYSILEIKNEMIYSIDYIEPRFCTYHNGDLYLTDGKSKSIIIMDKDYKCRQFNESIEMDPMGITTSKKDNQLFITDFTAHNIKVFNIHNGKFIKSYGSRGFRH